MAPYLAQDREQRGETSRFATTMVTALIWPRALAKAAHIVSIVPAHHRSVLTKLPKALVVNPGPPGDRTRFRTSRARCFGVSVRDDREDV